MFCVASLPCNQSSVRLERLTLIDSIYSRYHPRYAVYWLSEKILSFYEEIIDAQCFLFYVELRTIHFVLLR